MWPGSERGLNVNVRCDQGYGEAIDRAQLDLVHAEIARRSGWVLDVALLPWTKNLAKVSFFTISRIVFSNITFVIGFFFFFSFHDSFYSRIRFKIARIYIYIFPLLIVPTSSFKSIQIQYILKIFLTRETQKTCATFENGREQDTRSCSMIRFSWNTGTSKKGRKGQ